MRRPLLVLLAILFFVPTVAGASPALISVTYNASEDNPQAIGAAQLEKTFRAHAERRVVLDLLAGSSVGSEGALVTAVQQGAADICVVAGLAVSSVVPELGVFDVPFLFRDSAHAKAVVEGPIGRAIAAKFPEHNLVLLAIGEQGFRNLTNSKVAVRTPADLQGLKVRILNNDVYKMTFKALGAEPVPMDYPLVYDALKEGRIDGQENPLGSIASNRMYEVQKYVSLTQHVFGITLFLMNKQTYESLDAADVVAFTEAARAGAEATRVAIAQSEAKNLELLKNKGMTVVDTVDRDAFRASLASLEPEFEKRFGKAFLDDIRAAH